MGADNLPDEVTDEQIPAAAVEVAAPEDTTPTTWLDKLGRTVYTFVFTSVFTGIIVGCNFFGGHDVIAEKTVDGMSGLIELLIVSFLFAKTLDRSQLLQNIGVGIRHRGMGRRSPDEPQG
jgi:hypothetical protein